MSVTSRRDTILSQSVARLQALPRKLFAKTLIGERLRLSSHYHCSLHDGDVGTPRTEVKGLGVDLGPLLKIIAKVVNFLPNTKEVVAAGDFDENAAYWTEELEEWPHCRGVWLWVSGAIPEGLQIEESPMILDWSAGGLRSKDSTRWPLVNALLSDLLIYKVIAAEISSRERSRRWPHVFQSSGHIVADRINAGSAANQRGDNKSLRDLVYRKSYILHGDLGVMRKGIRNAQKTGEKTGNSSLTLRREDRRSISPV